VSRAGKAASSGLHAGGGFRSDSWWTCSSGRWQWLVLRVDSYFTYALAYSDNIDEVTSRRRAGLAPRWVTHFGYTLSVFSQAPLPNSAVAVGIGIMCTGDGNSHC